jgi:P4 family phage/plasmid primase-like protien
MKKLNPSDFDCRIVSNDLYERKVVSEELLFNNSKKSTFNYKSLYSFDKSLQKYYEKNSTTKGFQREHYSNEIIIDFDGDKEIDNLNDVKKEVGRFIEHLIDEYNIHSTNIKIFFSGRRGFHLIISRKFIGETTPSESFSQYDKEFIKRLTKGFKYVDLSLYNSSRIVRTKNSKHPESNFYKISLYGNQLKLGVEDIKELASKPRLKQHVELKIKQPCNKLSKLWNEAIEEVNDRNFKIQELEVTDISDYWINRYLHFLPQAIEYLKGEIYDYETWMKIAFSLAHLVYIKKISKADALRKFTIISLGNPHYPIDDESTVEKYFDKFCESYSSSINSPITIKSLFFIANEFGFDFPSIPNTDLQRAEGFAIQNSKDVKYNHNNNNWIIFNEVYWESDQTGMIHDKIMATIHSFKSSVNEEIMILVKCKETKEIKEKIKSNMRLLKINESQRSIKDMVTIAKDDKRIRITNADCDRGKYLFNCKNITLDLSHGIKPIKPQRDHLLTQNSHIWYDPSVNAKVFIKFLNDVFEGNQELIDFLQRSIGYCLTGSTVEDTIFFLYGSGANGKSTLLEIMKIFYGDYFRKANSNLFTKKRNNSIDNDIARLHNARFVALSETEKGQIINESFLKELTGGDTITSRMLYREFEEFDPTSKFWIAGNHKPIIRGNDEGVRRRIIIIPFAKHFPNEQQESREKLLNSMKSELSGILNWALEGYLDYKEHGLNPPAVIKNVTTEYLNEMDVVQNFIDDFCEEKNNLTVSFKVFYDTYKLVAEENGIDIINQRAFNSIMKNKGFNSSRKNLGYLWNGIRINYDLLELNEQNQKKLDEIIYNN